MSELVSGSVARGAAPVERAAPTGWQRFWRGMAYQLAALPLGIVAFVLSVTGFSVGVGTAIIWIGVPVLVGTLLVGRWTAGMERGMVGWASGRALPPHHYRPTKGAGRLARLVNRLRDPQSWRDLLHSVVAFPLRIAGFVIGVTWLVGGLGGALAVTWMWSIPYDDDGGGGLVWLLTGDRSPAPEIALNTVLGLVLLATAPLVLRGLVAVERGLAVGLLTNESAALRARATQLEAGRRAAVQAEAQTLRRLERDIHDGPQQRLVRLNMDLEAVVRRLDDDPDRARPLVAEALAQSREALDELRALSRGIAPPILADRGLGPALAAAAARCPVQVSLDVALPDGRRLAAAVENTAYFVVTEALTNVAKHAQATLCTVSVGMDAERVLVQVLDNGRGGAHLGKGHGLAGLADRLAAVEGELDVVSPVGGPTVLTAEIPLAGLGPENH
jgi:signal transduction histidine kinase